MLLRWMQGIVLVALLRHASFSLDPLEKQVQHIDSISEPKPRIKAQNRLEMEGAGKDASPVHMEAHVRYRCSQPIRAHNFHD